MRITLLVLVRFYVACVSFNTNVEQSYRISSRTGNDVVGVEIYPAQTGIKSYK